MSETVKKLTSEELNYIVVKKPYIIGKACGFDKLTQLNNDWIKKMIYGKQDETLQGHRGSYKTTCLSIALAFIVVIYPELKTLFMRKTDDDVKEIVMQVKKLLMSEYMQAISLSLYGRTFRLTTDNANEISTDLAANDPRGTAQLVAIGMGTSLTGKHFDRIFTDDIVNIKDRTSKADRDKTKLYYQELQNIKNRGGRIFNTGTPWHKDDAFQLMPNPIKYDCYSTGLMSQEEIDHLRQTMAPSLFSANYELRHIAAEDVIFDNPQTGYSTALAEQGLAHLDAAYGGSDYTAFTICRRIDGLFYVYGRCWQKNVEDLTDDIVTLWERFNCGRLYNEDNADKGFLARDLRRKGARVQVYHESMNKYIKIVTFLKKEWQNIRFVEGTDAEYIQQILDFNENVEHDDCADSLASLMRVYDKKKNENYQPLYNMTN